MHVLTRYRIHTLEAHRIRPVGAALPYPTLVLHYRPEAFLPFCPPKRGTERDLAADTAKSTVRVFLNQDTQDPPTQSVIWQHPGPGG